MTRRLLLALLAALALAAPRAWAGPPVATRDPPAGTAVARPGKVLVRVLVVHATNAHSRVDPSLRRIARYLQHLRYTGYELVEKRLLELGPRGSESFSIEGGREITVRVLSRDERRVRMRVQIETAKGGKLLDTTLSVNRNGTFIVAGPRYRDGILVIPLTVRY